MKKVTYIISDIDKAFAFEWIATHLDTQKIKLSFILINQEDSALERFLISKNIPVTRMTFNGKSSMPGIFLRLVYYFLTYRPDIIHCHLRNALLLSMPAAFITGIIGRIYTRHSSTYHHLFHPSAVKIDKMINSLSTKIVAISEQVKNVLIDLEDVPEKKIKLIHHGFDFDLFDNISQSEIDAVRAKYGIPSDKKVIGIISRYTLWKGFEYSIPAIGRFLQTNPDWHLVTANAQGNHDLVIRDLIMEHIKPEQVTQIKFENNLVALYKNFDLYVHVPYDPSVEAFGQTYVESLIAGVPSVFTLSGVASEFVENEYNALVVPFKDTDSITVACNRIANDSVLRDSLIKNGRISVERFNLKTFISNLEKLYLEK